MPAWFDIRGLGPSSAEDEDGIEKAAASLNSLIEKEISAGIPPNRIVIGMHYGPKLYEIDAFIS